MDVQNRFLTALKAGALVGGFLASSAASAQDAEDICRLHKSAQFDHVKTTYGDENPFEINSDGTIADEAHTVSEMIVAVFKVEDCDGKEYLLTVERRGVAEMLLTANVVANPTEDLVARYMAFANGHFKTPEEARADLIANKDIYLPQVELQVAFNELAKWPCSVPEYRYLAGVDASGFSQDTNAYLALDNDFLRAEFICPIGM